jgi:hypothetical protein
LLPLQIPSPLESLKTRKQLDRAVALLDTALFDAYNRCDLKKFGHFFAADLEFYHDQDGVILGRERLVQNIKEDICGNDVRRELVPGTLQAHRMKGYGFVAIGVHRFYHAKSTTPTGQGRFMNLWRYKGGVWEITRVFSFDHHAARK